MGDQDIAMEKWCVLSIIEVGLPAYNRNHIALLKVCAKAGDTTRKMLTYDPPFSSLDRHNKSFMMKIGWTKAERHK
jgi:hypothetical protein